MRKHWIAALAALLHAFPLAAAPTSAELAAADVAEALGKEMFAYDQAAWHATDRLMEDMRKRGTSVEEMAANGAHGYIVEPDSAGNLTAIFFGERNGRRFAVARYGMSGGVVSGGGFVEPDGASGLSPLADRMIDAREKALEAVVSQGRTFCTTSHPNSLVLPPRADGSIPVYIMSSAVTRGLYPAGGHYLFKIGPANALVSERKFMNTCIDVDWRKKDDVTPEMMFLTHLLDNHPTEVHVFVSLNVPVPLVVATVDNSSIWTVAGGRVQYVEEMPQEK